MEEQICYNFKKSAWWLEKEAHRSKSVEPCILTRKQYNQYTPTLNNTNRKPHRIEKINKSRVQSEGSSPLPQKIDFAALNIRTRKPGNQLTPIQNNQYQEGDASVSHWEVDIAELLDDAYKGDCLTKQSRAQANNILPLDLRNDIHISNSRQTFLYDLPR